MYEKLRYVAKSIQAKYGTSNQPAILDTEQNFLIVKITKTSKRTIVIKANVICWKKKKIGDQIKFKIIWIAKNT